MRAPLPPDEASRLAELRAYHVLDTLPEQLYDDLTRLAAYICGTSSALLTLVDEDRQWFKSRVDFDFAETSRESSFCAHAILDPFSLLIVPDTLLDKRFADNPLVTGKPHIRFYAGAPLVMADGAALGTLCVLDKAPRRLSADQRIALSALARQAMVLLELRRIVEGIQRAVK